MKLRDLNSEHFSLTFIAILVLFFVVTSCSRKPMETSVPFEVPDSFSASGEEELVEEWWTVFGEPVLNQVVDSALQNNFNLRSAWERLMAAQAVVDRESASFFPEIYSFLQGETGSGQTAFDVNDNMRMGLTADYELDLWGRIRSSIDAERFRAEAAAFDYQAASISLSAEIVLAWFRLAEARLQYALAQEQTNVNEKVLNLLRARFGSGQSRSVDILRQQELLEETREEEIIQEIRMRLLENQLAVLTGHPPQDSLPWHSFDLPGLPGLPETGIPLELVRRRPDVKSAWYRLNAADRDLASAMSSRYPRIALTAQISTQGGGADQLFRNWAWSLSGNLLAPLFYGGRLQAEVDRNQAIKNQILYEYGQTVLISFREVEDALVRESRQQQRIESLTKQHKLAEQAYHQLRVEYFNGFSNYLDVLTALEREQQLQRNLLAARLDLLEYRVALCRALAGGLNEEYTENNDDR